MTDDFHGTFNSTKIQKLLMRMYACSEAREWANDHPIGVRTWRLCERADWMLWFLEHLGVPERRVTTLLYVVLRTLVKTCTKRTEKKATELLRALDDAVKHVPDGGYVDSPDSEGDDAKFRAWQKRRDLIHKAQTTIEAMRRSRSPSKRDRWVPFAIDVLCGGLMWGGGDAWTAFEVIDEESPLMKLAAEEVRKNITWSYVQKEIRTYRSYHPDLKAVDVAPAIGADG